MVASTEGLRPVPPESVFKKLKRISNFFWIAAAVLIVFLFILKSQDRAKSQIRIFSDKDKFKIDFNLEKNDRASANLFLEKLGAAQSILDSGAQFSLDNTSSAKLAFAAPIKLDLKFKENSISFSGQSHIPFQKNTFSPTTAFKIPTGANLVLFGQDFKSIITNEQLSKELRDWINDNLNSQSGQYLITSGDNFALSFKPQKQLAFDKLSDVKSDDEPLYREDTVSDTVIHLVRASPKEEATWAIYQIGDWATVASSPDSAKNMISVQRGEAPYINFPKTDESISLAIYYRKGEGLAEGSLSQVTTNSQKLTKYLESTKEVFIMLNREKISGYVDF